MCQLTISLHTFIMMHLTFLSVIKCLKQTNLTFIYRTPSSSHSGMQDIAYKTDSLHEHASDDLNYEDVSFKSVLPAMHHPSPSSNKRKKKPVSQSTCAKSHTPTRYVFVNVRIQLNILQFAVNKAVNFAVYRGRS